MSLVAGNSSRKINALENICHNINYELPLDTHAKTKTNIRIKRDIFLHKVKNQSRWDVLQKSFYTPMEGVRLPIIDEKTMFNTYYIKNSGIPRQKNKIKS